MENFSHWHKLNLSPARKQFDVTIIGAGLTGLSLAYWVRKKNPTASILILEKKFLGYGASGRNAGFLTFGSILHFNQLVQKHGLEFTLNRFEKAQENMRLLKQHIFKKKSSNSELYFHQSGSTTLAKNRNEADQLENIANLMLSEGLPISIKTKSPTQFKFSAALPNEYSIDPYKLMLQMKKNISKLTLLEGIELLDYEELSNHIQLETILGSIQTSQLIFATNAYTFQNKLGKKLGLPEKIIPTKAQMQRLQLKNGAPINLNGNFYYPFAKVYFKTWNGSLLIGGLRDLDAKKEVGFDLNPNKKIQTALTRFAQKYIHPDLQLVENWVGTMGLTPSEKPILIRNLQKKSCPISFLGGFNGHGLGFGFVLSKDLIDSF